MDSCRRNANSFPPVSGCHSSQARIPIFLALSCCLYRRQAPTALLPCFLLSPRNENSSQKRPNKLTEGSKVPREAQCVLTLRRPKSVASRYQRHGSMWLGFQASVSQGENILKGKFQSHTTSQYP